MLYILQNISHRTLQHLGSGRFGSVSKGLWEVSGKSLPVAIKKLRPSASSTKRIKLLQEAAIMGQFNHSNVVQLYGLMTIGEPVKGTLAIVLFKVNMIN